MISALGSLTTTHRGTIVVHNEGQDLSATVHFLDDSSSVWKSLTSKKGSAVKSGVSGVTYLAMLIALAALLTIIRYRSIPPFHKAIDWWFKLCEGPLLTMQTFPRLRAVWRRMGAY